MQSEIAKATPRPQQFERSVEFSGNRTITVVVTATDCIKFLHCCKESGDPKLARGLRGSERRQLLKQIATFRKTADEKVNNLLSSGGFFTGHCSPCSLSVSIARPSPRLRGEALLRVVADDIGSQPQSLPAWMTIASPAWEAPILTRNIPVPA